LTPNRKNGRIALIAIISLVVLVAAVLAFLLFGSNATVAITMVTQSSSLTNLHYVASTNPYDAAHNTIASQVLTYTASVPGQGTATGVTQQGNSFATGRVIFTNTGTQPVDIPTGTVISTSGGIGTQFVTTADALVQPANSGFPAPPVPVQAQTAGTSGNVPANTITIVPANSLQSIAAAQSPAVPTISVRLSVMNPNATSGGGAANVQQVTSNDVNKLTKALHPKLQAQIAGWLAKVLQPQDVGGKMIPDVMGSPNPLPEEKLIANPQVGQVVASGQFTGVLSVSVKILVIRAATIQAVSKARINAQAVNMTPPHILAAQRPILISKMNSTPSADGTTLALTWTATGQIMLQVSAQKVSNLVAGKGVNQARNDIMNNVAGAIDARIDLFPSLLGIMPFRSEQIHVIMQPGPLT
jgi:Baseplate J-like protein